MRILETPSAGLRAVQSRVWKPGERGSLVEARSRLRAARAGAQAAETRAQKAETRARAAEARVRALETRARKAETRARDAEARVRALETRVGHIVTAGLTRGSSETGELALKQIAAQRRLSRARERRAMATLDEQGWPQTQIAEAAGVSQAHVSRTLASLKLHPELLDVGPAEVIWSRAAGEQSSEEMMAALVEWEWTFGAKQEDAWESQAWDDVELARAEGFLSDAEYVDLKAVVMARFPRDLAG